MDLCFYLLTAALFALPNRQLLRSRKSSGMHHGRCTWKWETSRLPCEGWIKRWLKTDFIKLKSWSIFRFGAWNSHASPHRTRDFLGGSRAQQDSNTPLSRQQFPLEHMEPPGRDSERAMTVAAEHIPCCFSPGPQSSWCQCPAPKQQWWCQGRISVQGVHEASQQGQEGIRPGRRGGSQRGRACQKLPSEQQGEDRKGWDRML